MASENHSEPQARSVIGDQRSTRQRSYRDLRVWQQAMDLAVTCYCFAGAFPKTEISGMVSQIRRSARSVAANLAEGWGRNSPAEMKRFTNISLGSLRELETDLLLSIRLGFGPADEAEALLPKADELGRMLYMFSVSVERKKAIGSGDRRSLISPMTCNQRQIQYAT